MKPTPHENPDLTAYAVGELDACQARDIHALLAACPVATHELEQVEAVTDALRQGAPIPQERLRPEQRHAVLYPSNLPRRMGPMMPRPIQRRPSVLWPVVGGILKAAAVLALTGAAYLVGRHVNVTSSSTVALISDLQPVQPVTVPEVQVHAPIEPVVVVAPVAVTPQKEIPVAPAPLALPEKAPVIVVQTSAAESSSAGPPAPVMKTLVVKAAPAVAKAVRPMPTTTPGKHVAFVSANRQPMDQFALKPAQIRPLPAKVNKRELLASPAPLHLSPDPKDNGKTHTPDLYIHSWKAEVATCPWDESHRLLRVTIQLPADQPAALTQATYPLRITFDPLKVREYRQLCERHQPAQELRQAGTHVVWYEYLPNGDTDGSKNVATVTLDKGRFTTQTVGPFDSSQLNVQDRGQAWQNAREDFVFDSAVVGFGLLMRGVPNTPNLNHELVLSLAERSKGKDVEGDRAKFIKLVIEATKTAGL